MTDAYACMHTHTHLYIHTSETSFLKKYTFYDIVWYYPFDFTFLKNAGFKMLF